jgi:protein gp37
MNTSVKTRKFLKKPLTNTYPSYASSIDPFQRAWVNGFHPTMRPEKLQHVYRQKQPALVFPHSVSDWMQVDFPSVYLSVMLDTWAACPHLIFQPLTKRAERMAEFFSCRQVPDNIWLGVSVEDRKYGVPRIKQLQSINAKTRWLSIEPLLEDLGELDLDGIHWVVVGGESGSKKVRAMHIDWVRSIRDQCVSQGIPFFFKQWGSHDAQGTYHHKSKTGRELDGRTWTQYPPNSITDQKA